jgi:threonine dehydrogenase-like Zn-dependent dehydrogenase
MSVVTFDAFDYHADGSFSIARYRFDGDEWRGWRIWRDGDLALELGRGYRLLRTEVCGVCSTDLARRFLPFPLPQVTGHELIARDAQRRRYVVEINASHTARGLPDGCAFCTAGLPTHCPERLVLGIHGLPGGFGPWILAPVAACIEVPDAIPDSAAVLVEPFAAALHAVATVAPRAGDRIAVLGPRRLGMLVLGSLAATRARMRATGADFAITALVRDAKLAPVARALGATAVATNAGELPAAAFDVVFDTTGNPDALALAVRLARREVHLKSTHGQPACGLSHLTELVVDELALAPFADATAPVSPSLLERLRTGSRARVAWLVAKDPPAALLASADVQRGEPAVLHAHYAKATAGLPRADVAVAATPAQIDAAIRPVAGVEAALVRPRGAILVHPSTTSTSPLLRAIVDRSLRLTSSRCGDFRAALAALAGDAELAGIGEGLITHRFAVDALPQAFATAASRKCIKAVVEHRSAD